MLERRSTMENDDMQISVLASGSTGNVTYVETPQHKILLDAGLSGKKNCKPDAFNWT